MFRIDRMPTSDELNSCEYLRNVLKETLRVVAPGACVFRNAAETIKCGGFRIPAGYSASSFLPVLVP